MTEEKKFNVSEAVGKVVNRNSRAREDFMTTLYYVWKEEGIELPPLKEFNYPIKIGDKWNATALITDLFDNATEPFTGSCECLRQENFKLVEVNNIENVTYNCYVVKSITPFDDYYLAGIYWMAPDAGNYIYAEEYLLNDSADDPNIEGFILSSSELISFSYTPPAAKKTPGFESAMAFMALTAVVLLWAHKKRKY